jgi:hypothetical protein
VCSQEAPDQKDEKLQTKRRRSFRPCQEEEKLQDIIIILKTISL